MHVILLIMMVLMTYSSATSNDNTHVHNTQILIIIHTILTMMQTCTVYNMYVGTRPDGFELEVLLTLRADNKCTLRYLVLDKAFVVDSSGVHKVQSHHLIDLIPLT